MSGVQAVFQNQRSFSPPPPTTIGQAYGGGFYAGKIAVGGGGFATHYLIVAPKASGENAGQWWGPMDATTGITSVINGPTNSASLAALGNSYSAAKFAEDLSIGGYTDWYLPAKNELEVLYYFLRPSITFSNLTIYGANPNAVSPEPISTNYTASTPTQTSAIAFRTGGADAFVTDGRYWSSSETSTTNAWTHNFTQGQQTFNSSKNTFGLIRAVRRVAV